MNALVLFYYFIAGFICGGLPMLVLGFLLGYRRGCDCCRANRNQCPK